MLYFVAGMSGKRNRERFVAEALLHAEKSSCLVRHGALIVRGKQVFASGYNTAQRCRFLGGHDVCIHAEMAAVTMFINHYVRKRATKFRVKHHGIRNNHANKVKGDKTRGDKTKGDKAKGDKTKVKRDKVMYDLSDFTVWCIKASSAQTQTTSMPCAMCLYRLKRFGFGKIAYIDRSGAIRVDRLVGTTSDHISSAHRCILTDTSSRGMEVRKKIRFPSHVSQILLKTQPST